MNEDTLEDSINESEKWLVDGLNGLKDRIKIINDDIYVRTGQTLTINSGSIWKFATGKGIYVEGGLLQILGTEKEPVVLEANMITWNGITIYDSKLENSIKYTTIRDGKKDGGGINVSESNLFLNYSTIEKCEAELYGGAIYCSNNSSIKIENTIIKENHARDCGGGIYNNGASSLRIENTIIKDNRAIYGGGIDNGDNIYRKTSLRLENVQIIENIASHGGGIYNVQATLVLFGKNTIENNTPDNIDNRDIK